MKTIHTTRMPVEHNGSRVAAGKPIELTREEAEQLLAAGAIKATGDATDESVGQAGNQGSDQADDLHAELQESWVTIDELRRQLAVAAADLATAQSALQESSAKVTSLQEQLATRDGELKAADDHLASLTAELSAVQTAHAAKATKASKT